MFEEPRDALYLLQRWYLSQCNDEWEHSYGVTITTLDNPGWSLRVELSDTALAGLTVQHSRIERSEHDWVDWHTTSDHFEAACGPTNLNEGGALRTVDRRRPHVDRDQRRRRAPRRPSTPSRSTPMAS